MADMQWNEINELNWYLIRKIINLPNLQLVNTFHLRTNFSFIFSINT